MARVLITGGAGFIGCNLVYRLVGQGHEVTIIDNLSRPGSSLNLAWLSKTLGPHAFRVELADICDSRRLQTATQQQDCIYHLAAQTAVTVSVDDPVGDAQDNIIGTLNVLEAARLARGVPLLVFASTNKVYGRLDNASIREEPKRYVLDALPWGVSENFPVDCRSPYACSKAAGEAYVRHYAQQSWVRAVILRQSCIYGPHQFGTEEQGWVSWFIRAALRAQQISLFGDGKQLRDLLWVDDLLDLYCQILTTTRDWAGEVFNVGGGPLFTLSIWAEFEILLRELGLKPPMVVQMPQRIGDQCAYVSDVRNAEVEFNWRPKVPPREGVSELIRWTKENCLDSVCTADKLNDLVR